MIEENLLKKVNLIVVFIILGAILVVAARVAVDAARQPQKIQGTSTFAALDIVSADIPSGDKQVLLDSLDTITGESLRYSDLALQTGSYKKSYISNDDTVATTYRIDVAKVKSSYDVTHNTVGGHALPISVSCSTEQPTGYACVYKATGGDR